MKGSRSRALQNYTILEIIGGFIFGALIFPQTRRDRKANKLRFLAQPALWFPIIERDWARQSNWQSFYSRQLWKIEYFDDKSMSATRKFAFSMSFLDSMKLAVLLPIFIQSAIIMKANWSSFWVHSQKQFYAEIPTFSSSSDTERNWSRSVMFNCSKPLQKKRFNVGVMW